MDSRRLFLTRAGFVLTAQYEHRDVVSGLGCPTAVQHIYPWGCMLPVPVREFSSQTKINQIIIHRGLRRGGLTPAFAPRMPVIITEDVLQYRQIEAVNATALLPRFFFFFKCLNEDKESTGTRFSDSMNQQQILPSGTR